MTSSSSVTRFTFDANVQRFDQLQREAVALNSYREAKFSSFFSRACGLDYESAVSLVCSCSSLIE
jgi:hypothetical protein